MKTFKMISINIFHEGKFHDYPLIDGIIINQENSHRMWILEMFIEGKHKSFFEAKMSKDELIETKVVISYPENEPAAFHVAIMNVKQIGENISVLMKGRLKRARSQYAEQLLEQLIDEGLSGQELLGKFESDMRSRPRLKKDRQNEELTKK
ncbi:YwpF family protein [Sporosarcina pasteurii]|uniref:YwpF-like protein n=1 Tax=Sporosarcina pasteurii TaxID=1474 RepID=A0A380BCG9_SPOPA|nr:YwpF family protein [Sporosarcina pasteurii]MDS9472256.1 YwpF family protein [Sporosarcina pasteurii]QBQ06238.1 hypothetical protein E2C16_11435 [Sporosarcina pasteurii]SUI99124.1 Uncharacterised protein [Sporosarcina pasteurii]